MLNGSITLSQKTRVESISLIKNYEVFNTSSKAVVYTNLFSNEKYIA